MDEAFLTAASKKTMILERNHSCGQRYHIQVVLTLAMRWKLSHAFCRLLQGIPAVAIQPRCHLR